MENISKATTLNFSKHREHVWDRYETDRAYILKLLGFGPFECDTFSHVQYSDLPKRIKMAIVKAQGK